MTVSIHPGDLRRFAVQVQGPYEEHSMTVFATGWDDAAEAAVEKIKDKIIRHEFDGWGPVEGPWTVLSIAEC